MIKKITTTIAIFICMIFTVVLLLPGIRGTNEDRQYYEKTRNREVGGPFESSGSTSRYVLTETLAKESRITLTEDEARFASPDVAGVNKKYFSLFMPGLSYAAVPFYMLGSMFSSGQMAAYSINILFAILNVGLIVFIVRRLTGGIWLGLFSGLTFLFATNAFAYSFYFTQHHLGTFCLLALLSLYLLPRNLLTNTLAGFVYGFSIFTDMPNAIILFPVMLFIFVKNFSVKDEDKNTSVKIKLSVVGLLLGLFPMMFALGIYNKNLTGSPTLLPQFIGRSSDFTVQPEKELINKPEEDTSSETTRFDHNTPFFSRFIVNGFYILLASDERGWLVYSPIVLLGMFGIYKGLKKHNDNNFFVQLLVSTILMTLLLYAMFGDPWGGWSFGPRYMIPAAAVMCILLGYSISEYKQKILYLAIIPLLLCYCIFVNTLGAITTTQIPPKQEAIYLSSYIPYTYAYNLDLIEKKQTRSYFYNTYMRNIVTLRQFYIYYSLIILTFMLVIYTAAVMEKHKKI